MNIKGNAMTRMWMVTLKQIPKMVLARCENSQIRPKSSDSRTTDMLGDEGEA